MGFAAEETPHMRVEGGVIRTRVAKVQRVELVGHWKSQGAGTSKN